MLDFQVQQSPFRFGLQEGIEPHQVNAGTLLTASNCEWLKSGKLQKRPGTAGLSTTIVGGGNVSAGARLLVRNGELCLIDGSRLYSYAPLRGGWVNIGAVNEVIPTWQTALDTQSGIASCDVAYVGGVLYYAWTSGDPWQTNVATNVTLQAVEATTGAVLYGPTVISSGPSYGVRVLASSTGIVVLTRTGAAPPYSISAAYFDTSTMALTTSMTPLKSDSNLSGGFASWDATLPSPTKLVIGYNRTGSIIALESFTITGAAFPSPCFVAAASGTVTDASGCKAIAIDGVTGESLYVAYLQGGGFPNVARLAVNDPTTLTASVVAATIDTPSGFGQGIGVARYSSTRCVIWVNAVESNSAIRCTSQIRNNTGTVYLSNGNYGSVWATSRPVMIGSKPYFMGVTYAFLGSGTAGANSVLLCADEVRHLGQVDLLVGGISGYGITPGAIVATSATTWVTLSPFQATVTPQSFSWRQGARLVQFSNGVSRPLDTYRGLAVGAEAFCSGGGLVSYDGAATFDYGFPSTPVLFSTTATGAGSITAGTYLYTSVTEFRSRTGLYYRSPAADQITQVTTTASSTNTVNVISANLWNKPNTGIQVTEGFYRSTAGGSNLQRLSFEPRFNTLYLQQNVVTQTLTDNVGDASISPGAGTTALATRPVVYTTGGVLFDYAAPACVTMNYHVGRLWVLAGDQKTWWYSKSFQDDLGTAPGFSPSFLISFPDVQTAMASMDDKAIFFSATGVKYMLGTGPAPNGANSDFQTPTTIQSDVGCTSARSVVTTPDGVMFLSDRGLYLLDRGLTLSWIGRPVKDTLAAYPVVTSAVLVAKKNQVRFTCTNTAGTSGTTIVYDYVEKEWATWTHFTDPGYGGPIADAVMWNGSWTFLTPTGAVFVESTTSYLDSGNYVPMTLETAWITAPSSQASPSAGPLKFQSVRTMSLHGFSNTDHDLTVQVGFDTVASYPQSITFPATGAVTSVGSLDDCQVSIGTRRKCNAIRFKISDASPSAGTVGTGQGPSFDMMALEVGIKRGTGNTPATKKG